MLASLLFPYDDDAPHQIEGWLIDLSTQGCIDRYSVDGSAYIQVTNWTSHQKIDKPSASKLPAFDEKSRTFASIREHSSEDQGPRTKDQGPKDQETTPRKRSATPVFELPDWINRTHWDAWHSCPKRKKATAEQKQMAIDKLDKWREAGQDHAGALENAAVGGYQGLFLPDAQKAGNQSFAQQAADVARTTVPSRVDRDPVLVEYELHASKAAPIPANIREQLQKLKGSVLQ